MDFVAQLGPQPNFTAMAEHMTGIAHELPKMANVPALNQGQEILNVLQQIQVSIVGINTRLDSIETRLTNLENRMDRLETRFDNLEARFDRLEARFDAFEVRFNAFEVRFNEFEVRFNEFETRVDARFDSLEVRLEASDANSLARLFNSHMTIRDGRFEPLRSIRTNQVIAGLKDKSLNDIEGMTGSDYSDVLEALGLDTSGTTAARQKRVLRAMGVVNMRLQE